MECFTESDKKRMAALATEAGDWDLVNKIARINVTKSDSDSDIEFVRENHGMYELTANDIVNESLLSKVPGWRIKRADLSCHIFIPRDDPVINYFRTKPLCNLQEIDLSYCVGVNYFINAVFGADGADTKFYLLSSITMDEKSIYDVRVIDTKSPFDDGTALDVFYDHFTGYEKFVRAKRQVSCRYDVLSAYVSIYLNKWKDKPAGHQPVRTTWTNGRIDRKYHKIYYLWSKDSGNGPLIMGVEFK